MWLTWAKFCRKIHHKKNSDTPKQLQVSYSIQPCSFTEKPFCELIKAKRKKGRGHGRERVVVAEKVGEATGAYPATFH